MSIDPNANKSDLPSISGYPLPSSSGTTPIIPLSVTDSTGVAASTTAPVTEHNINLAQPTRFEMQGLDWGKFLMLIWSTNAKQQEQRYSEEVPTEHQKGMHIYASVEAAALAKLALLADKYLKKLEELVNQLDRLNRMIKNSNDQMQQLTDEMNKAIKDHNDGTMNDQQFQRAVDQYNSQKDTLLSQFQNDLITINQEIEVFNQQADEANNLSKGWDVGTISHANQISSSINLPSVSIGTTDLLPTPAFLSGVNVQIPSLSKEELLDKIYNARVDDFIESMKVIAQSEKVTDAIRESHVATLKLIFPSSTVGQIISLAGSTSVANVVVSLTSQSIQASLNRALFQSVIRNEKIKSTENLLNELQALALMEITHTSLFTVLGTDPTLGDNEATVGNVAINFALNISKFLKSDTLNDIFKNYAVQHELSEKETAILKAAFSQTLWTIAVSNLSKATGMYGLPAQLLGNLPEFEPLSPNEQPLDLKTLLSSPAERKAFEEELINLMVMNNRSSFEAAQIIAGNVVGALQLLDTSSPEQIHKALVQQLGSNFDASFSNTLANTGLTYILNSRLNTELQGHPVYLSNLILEGSQYISKVQNQQTPFAVDSVHRDKFVNSLALLLEQEDPSHSFTDASIDANRIWGDVQKNPTGFASINDFYSFVAQRISNTVGTSPDSALRIAQSVDLGNGNVPLDPLVSVGKNQVLSREDLADSFNAQLRLFYTTHGVSPTDAQKQSDAVTKAMITGPTSMLNLMLAIDDDYKKAGIERTNDLWVETYREDSAISRELAAFIASTTVNPLLFSQLVTISGGTKGETFQTPIQG